MIFDLFADDRRNWREEICEGATVLRGFALASELILLDDINAILNASPPQSMATPGGLPMSVVTTSCGSAGWVSDSYGYRYSARDLTSGRQWLPLPDSFLQLAQRAAAEAGYPHFMPDSCLINIYKIGAKMSLHQDKNERDFTQPIVSLSLGLPARFLLGGSARSDKVRAVALSHGDVLVWGGVARLNFHGVLPIKAGVHPLLGERRINLTFRKAW